MKSLELWEEYLETMDMMTQYPATYSLEKKRSEIHFKLFEFYCSEFGDIDKKRFDNICHNLDKIVNFNPPLERFDKIKLYAKDIDRYMFYLGKKYITGFISTLGK